MLPPDATLHNRYRIIYTVDERPTGILYRARDEQSGRLVLIAGMDAGGQLDELRALARQVATVRHEALLPLNDHFEERGALYLVCDDVGGQDLERTLRARGRPLAEGPALGQLQRLLELLDHLNGQRPALFLGEPTPADIWIDEQGTWRLAPFTLVRPIGSAVSPYRAPDLDVAGAEPTAASDIYALVALLYYALTGWAPPTAAQRAAGTPLNSPRALNASLSTLAEQVLLRGLQLKRENRYQVARELHRSLDMVQMMDGRGLGSGPDVPPSQPAAVPPQMPPPAQPAPPAGYAAPPPPPATPGMYSAPPQPAPPPAYPPAYAQPYPPPAPAAPERKRGLSTGCLVAIAVVLTLAAVLICGALGLYFFTGGQLFGLFGGPNSVAGAAATAPAATAQVDATSAPAGDAAGATPAPVSTGAGAITLANAGALQQTREITGAEFGPVAYSPDGTTLAIGVSEVINLQSAETLEDLSPPRRMVGHTSLVFTVAWSPDGKLLASGAIDDNDIRIWNTADASLARTLRGHTGWIRSVAFSPDGRRLASGSLDETVRVWDVASGELLYTLRGHAGFISTAVFSPDGAKLVSSASDGTVIMWDAANGQRRTDFAYESPPNLASGAKLWTTGLAFTPDGATLAIGLQNGSVAIVDAASGELRRTLTGHASIVVSRGVAFAPDGRTLATASFDGTVRLWDVTSGTQTALFDGHGLRVLSVSFSPDGTHVASTSDQGGQLYIWDARQQEDPRSYRVGQGMITSLVFAPDSSLLGMVGYNGSSRLYLIEQDQSRVLLGSSIAKKSLGILSDGRIISITDQGGIAVVRPSDTQATTLSGLDGRPLNVVVSGDGNLIVAASSTGAIGRWDSATGEARAALQSTQLKQINDLAVNDDGSLIAAGGPQDDARIELWDGQSGQLRTTLAAGDSAIIAMEFQPRGGLLAAADLGGTLRIWNTQDGALVKTIKATSQQQWFSALAFSPDGATLMTGTPTGQITFWNPQTGEAVATLPPLEYGVFSAAFSPDGRRLVVGLGDQSVRFFEVAQGA